MARILVVDDEPDLVELIEDVLAPLGHEIIRAYSGEEALDKLTGERPDLILLDIMMPGMGGIEACERIKDNPETADIVIVMVTAKKENESFIDAIYVESDGYVTKPFTIDGLVAAVDKYLPDTHDTSGGT